MRVPGAVADWLSGEGYGAVVETQHVGGGCINNGAILISSSGRSFFLKTNARNPADMFAREADGLTALQVEGGPRLPKAYIHGREFLLLEDLNPAGRGRDYWQVFGRQLATVHLHTSERFGFEHDNYIGSTPQPNPWMQDGHEFFGEQRLLFQARMAQRRGLLEMKAFSQVERLVSRLAELVPEQPASLMHGDLWSGNAMTDAMGAPAIIDPAAHYGWAEAELAMTSLFGAFPEEFYRAYQEARPLAPDFRKRFPIYNLYHTLNHLNLFGAGYRGQVLSALHRYA